MGNIATDSIIRAGREEIYKRDVTYKEIIGVGGFSEVHKIYKDSIKGECARKIITLGKTRLKDVENEIRAIEKLCTQQHPNIIEVFTTEKEQGDHLRYHIDMEICNFDLETYLDHVREDKLDKIVAHNEGELPKDMKSPFDILKDIVNGVVFIHEQGEVHRDLKPRNVLYSRSNNNWKITDFGFTSEGTSKRSNTTDAARGTNCYRAPELVGKQKDKFTYSNKVDIWALGCIFYEVAFLKKAFHDDWAVREYESVVELEEFQSPIKSTTIINDKTLQIVASLTKSMLDINPYKRPRANVVQENFCTLTMNESSLLLFVKDVFKDAFKDAFNPPHIAKITLRAMPGMQMCIIWKLLQKLPPSWIMGTNLRSAFFLIISIIRMADTYGCTPFMIWVIRSWIWYGDYWIKEIISLIQIPRSYLMKIMNILMIIFGPNFDETVVEWRETIFGPNVNETVVEWREIILKNYRDSILNTQNCSARVVLSKAFTDLSIFFRPPTETDRIEGIYIIAFYTFAWFSAYLVMCPFITFIIALASPEPRRTIQAYVKHRKNSRESGEGMCFGIAIFLDTIIKADEWRVLMWFINCVYLFTTLRVCYVTMERKSMR